ncbi:DNA primase [Sulfobacillus sp. hq2]|uniref:DNA primase n=1 Tax=Sulfobacillus TaxID=28033 RepID=UPI000CD1BABF|nr:DNA primase [Sulfobacillus sp. hq2]POB10119.1 DNA primase [Sulfobacillus sp. hq2]
MASIHDIRQTWELVAVPGYLVEVRILRRGARPAVGRFTHLDRFVQAVTTANARPDVSGIYVTLNPVAPDAPWVGPFNQVRIGGKAARDTDVAYRRWLLVDCDPVRPAKTNATVAERRAAFTKAGDIGKALRALGWPDPVQAVSGNGAHLLYRLADWPNDKLTTERVQWMLKTLAHRFTDGTVDVDVSVFNASRISKVYGTVPKKGAPSAERPWWPAQIVHRPDPLVPLDHEGWRVLSRWAVDPVHKVWVPSRTPPRASASWTHHVESVCNQLAAWGLDILAEPMVMPDGRTKILVTCPWEAEHSGSSGKTESAVFWSPDGTLGYKCQHMHCAERRWRDVRRVMAPTTATTRSSRSH